MLTVLLGGARSGKSALAVEVALLDGGDVTYLATSPQIAGDDDLARRVARHRSERPRGWTTIEEEIDLAGAIERVTTAVVIVDCLTVWLGNALHHGQDSAAIEVAGDAALAALRARRLHAIAVTNEVGLGIVPSGELGRQYRDLLGRINQRWVAAADRALFMVAGKAIPLSDPWDLLA